MKSLRKQNYLMQVKGFMLLHFSHKDICSVLEDLNEFFESGKKDGKTEEELCSELGHPKDFAEQLLHDNRHNKFLYYVFIYLVSAVAIGVFITYIFESLNPVCWCVPAAGIPIYIWYLCGGACLYGFQDCTTGHKTAYAVFNRIVFVCVIGQQCLAFIPNVSEEAICLDVFHSCVAASYYLSVLFIVILILFAGVAIYKIYCGDYLSFNNLLLYMGAVFSTLSYVTYIKSFNGADMFSSICLLPYLVCVILSLVLPKYLRR